MTIPKPRWFRTDTVMVSTAPTCGISKSGQRLVKFEPSNRHPNRGARSRDRRAG